MQDSAIVLKVNNYKDRDLIISFLSKENGRLTACARNAKGSKKRFSGGIDIFNCAKIKIGKKNNRPNNLESYSIIESWQNLATNPKLFSLSSFCIEVILSLTQEDQEEALELFMPLFKSLRLLNKSENLNQQKSICIFLSLQSLEITGFGLPNLEVPSDKNKDLSDWIYAMSTKMQPIVPKKTELIDLALEKIKFNISNLTGREIRSLDLI